MCLECNFETWTFRGLINSATCNNAIAGSIKSDLVVRLGEESDAYFLAQIYRNLLANGFDLFQ